MNKVNKSSNINNKRAATLFVTQVILGVMPVLLLVAFVWFKLYRIPILAAVAIGLILLCNLGYILIGQRYAVLNSGIQGERQLYKTVKRLSGNNIIFRNLPVRYKRGRSELDLLIVSHSGIIIVEVKNHSGTIIGSWKSEKWTQRKDYGEGRSTRAEMDDPIKPMRRQRDIVKSILNAAGEDVWIDTVLYFSSPRARLRLNLRENDYVCAGSTELLCFLENYKGHETLSRTRMDKIEKILKEASGNA